MPWVNFSKIKQTAFIADATVSIQTLSALENAIEPYLDAGYAITSQSDWAITLRAPVRKFSWIFFLFTLIFMWPVAIIYVVWFNQHRDRTVSIRFTSEGYLEERGFILDLLLKERRRQKVFSIIFIVLVTLLAVAISFLILRSKIR